MEPRATRLIGALKTAQRQRKLGDKAFSRHLNISDSYWWMIRHGKRRPSLNLIFTIYKRVPEASESVDAYLRQSNDE